MSSEHDGLPNAIRHFSEIAERIRGRELAVFLDYDGTLTPIVPRPELAVLNDAMRDTLMQVSQSWTTAIISGRAGADVRKLVGLDRLYYAGNHGLEIDGPRGMSLHHELGREFRPDLVRCKEQIQGDIGHLDGVLIEDKGLSLSVHYRLVAASLVPQVKAAVDEVMPEVPRLLKRSGKKVIELRPRIDWDKGYAVQWLLEVVGGAPMPVFIGDDKTDEDAFRVLPEGIRVKVGGGLPTEAEFGLADTDEVRRFLELLVPRDGVKVS